MIIEKKELTVLEFNSVKEGIVGVEGGEGGDGGEFVSELVRSIFSTLDFFDLFWSSSSIISITSEIRLVPMVDTEEEDDVEVEEDKFTFLLRNFEIAFSEDASGTGYSPKKSWTKKKYKKI